MHHLYFSLISLACSQFEKITSSSDALYSQILCGSTNIGLIPYPCVRGSTCFFLLDFSSAFKKSEVGMSAVEPAPRVGGVDVSSEADLILLGRGDGV